MQQYYIRFRGQQNNYYVHLLFMCVFASFTVSCRLCAECAASCTTCFYDSDGNNLCARCNIGYAISQDSRSCLRMPDIF